MNPNGQPRGYEQVRRALLERGYLEAPLERLFLGGLGDPLRQTRRGRLLSALLAGMFGGPLLGMALAGSLVLQSHGAVPVWPDGLLYAVLFSVVLGLSLSVTEGVVTFLIQRAHRWTPLLSPRRAALVAGLSVAGILSAYLGAWWFQSGGQLEVRGLIGLLALALAAGFAGRIVGAAALVQAAVASGRVPLGRRPAHVLGLLVLAASGLALAGALVAALPTALSRDGVPVTVAAGAPRRAVLVGWDGLSLELARGLERRGGAENRPSFLSRIATWAPLVSVPNPDPAAVWTTIATGCPPAVHGIEGTEHRVLRGAAAPLPTAGLASGPLDLLTRLWPTRRLPVQVGARRVPAVWEYAAGARKTAVIGWWGTWPASPLGSTTGYVVSDGALVALRQGRGIEEAIIPAGWAGNRGSAWLKLAEERAGVRPAAGSGASQFAWEALVADLFALEALKEVLADPELGTVVVYLPGIDILRERWRQAGRDLFEIADAVLRHSQAVERRLGEIVSTEPGGERGSLVFLAGFPGRAGEGEHGFVARLGPLSSRPLAAPRSVPVPLESVAPTFLGAAGYTLDERIAGAPDLPLAGLARSPQRWKTAVNPATSRPLDQTLEDDLLERLRSLGYVR